jgi:hypothetical protein
MKNIKAKKEKRKENRKKKNESKVKYGNENTARTPREEELNIDAGQS